jgi:hypothetical protein
MLPNWETRDTEEEDDVEDELTLESVDEVTWHGISVNTDGAVIDGQGAELENWDELAKLITNTVIKINRLVQAAKGDD